MREYLSGIYVCRECGWWTAELEQWTVEPHQHARVVCGAAASLRELDLTDMSTPIDDVRAYLVARYESRIEVSPRLMEETVASVFSSLGYEAHVTGYSGDDGIDIILNKGDETVGVQVKRHKNAIEVEQIRSLAGALVLGGLTKGIFVTTSDFQSGAYGTVSRLASKGYAIELCNSAEFYSALKLAQRSVESVVAALDRVRIMNNLVEIERTYEANPHGP